MIEEAIALHRGGDVEGAEKAYRQILEAEPDHFEAMHFLALIRQDAGALDEALDLVEKAIELKPDVGTYHATLGSIRFAQGDLAAARANYEQALDLNPNLPQGHNTLGFLQLQMGETALAEKTLNTALRLDPESPQIYANLGQALLAQGRFDEAASHAQTALSLDPKHLPSRATLAEALMGQGAFAIAEQAWRTCLNDRPDVPAWQAGLADTLLAQDRAAEARSELHQALPNHPDHPLLRAAAGQASLALGHWHDAAEHFKQSLLARPGHPQTIEGLGDALRARGELAQAQQCFDAVNSSAARVKSLQVRAELGDTAGAESGLQALLAQSPAPAAAALALATLKEKARDPAAAGAILRRWLDGHTGDGAGNSAANAVALKAAGLALTSEDRDGAAAALARFVANQASDQDAAQARELQARLLDLRGDYAGAASAFQAVTQELRLKSLTLPDPELPPALATPVDDGREPPVLLAGLPGSGVHWLAELLATSAQFDVMVDRFAEPGQRRDFLDASASARRGKRSDEEHHRLERRAYWNAAERQRRRIQGRVLAVDHVPLTQCRLGALGRYFPGARVILAVRHPGDLLLHTRTLGWRDGIVSADTLHQFYRSALDAEGLTLYPVPVDQLAAADRNPADMLNEVLGPLLAHYEINADDINSQHLAPMTDQHLPGGHFQHYQQSLALLNPALSQLAADLGFNP